VSSPPRRILLIQTAFIGDAILASSLLEAVHQHWPETRIDLLVRKGNESLFKGHPFLHSLLVWNKQERKYLHLFQLLNTIRRNRYDMVVNLQRFLATGLLTALSGAPLRVGFQNNPLAFAFTHRVKHQVAGAGEEPFHEVQRNYSLLQTWLPNEPPPRPRLYPSPEDYQRVQRPSERPYVCMAPTSVWFTKQWPAERWVALINRIPETVDVLLLGGPPDRDACQAIAEASTRPVENLAGSINLLQSAALMQGAQMNYVNDSAPLHLCSAVNVPVAAVFCSTVPGFGFGPLSEQASVHEYPGELSCRPCGLHGHRACPEGHFRCADIPLEPLLEVLPRNE
jgi:lipopolysaccharide heptosyltransferase II